MEDVLASEGSVWPLTILPLMDRLATTFVVSGFSCLCSGCIDHISLRALSDSMPALLFAGS
eukprot:1269812-Ditylum_brightwellii.AAC.1